MTENLLATERGGVHYWVAGPAGAGGGTRSTTSGGAVPIVFTHGATMDHEMFDSQVDRFSGDRIVISWDVPAHGKSRPYSDFTLKAAADDLAAILDAEKIENAHLVGQSMGGYISQVFAVEFPERVASFCALDSSPLRGDYYSGLDRWMLSITPAILGLYPYGMLVRTIANQVSVSEAGRAYALRTLETYTKAEIAVIMEQVYLGVVAYANRDVPLRCPVLIVVGENDRSGKVMSYSRRWARTDGLPLVVIPNAGHNSNVDNPEAFNRTLAEFIDPDRS